MKKLFLIGIIFAGSIGLSIAATTTEEAVQICWHNSCDQIHCGAYYLSTEIGELVNDMANSEQDCPTDNED